MENIKILTVVIAKDVRGYNAFPYDASISASLNFNLVQVNQAFSVHPYTLRGIHFQKGPDAQAKLIQCITGSIFNVAVDVRQDSSTFGQYRAEILSAENHKMMLIPKGFAHGYMTLEQDTFVQWCVDNKFCKDTARCIHWDSCGINWPMERSKIIVSDKDNSSLPFKLIKELLE